ncbi:hypothetical protein Drose_34945 [Dactylosporangium roseum]|uniref:Uncharacterized protein n=1 Tax=Dactylosporangium roseum TaxID=47989 RepID=A0ABY5Z324_9ACTN|nr:hypothetical protein [Dactylosporangium roseum]UWZ36197.1 hypothetical protein Drose_34945 [Dactylosporangium roseum]
MLLGHDSVQRFTGPGAISAHTFSDSTHVTRQFLSFLTEIGLSTEVQLMTHATAGGADPLHGQLPRVRQGIHHDERWAGFVVRDAAVGFVMLVLINIIGSLIVRFSRASQGVADS